MCFVENRAYLPASIINNRSTITNLCYGLFDAPLWNLGILLSKLHLVWISTVCGQLETRIRYSNTMGWNTFPIPRLTGQNINDLTYCRKILEIREKYFPAVADLYETGSIPNDLLAAHELMTKQSNAFTLDAASKTIPNVSKNFFRCILK